MGRNSKILLLWYVMKNIEAAEEKGQLERMLNWQRKVRKRLGWRYQERSNDEREEEVKTFFAEFLEEGPEW